MSRLRQLSQLIPKGLQDRRTPSRGTEDNFKATALRDDKGGRLIVIRIAVCVGADFLCLLRIQARGAGSRRTVLTGTAVFSFVVLRTRAETRVEDWSLDIVVWVWVDAITWLQGWCELKRPWTPALHEGGGDRLIKRQRE